MLQYGQGQRQCQLKLTNLVALQYVYFELELENSDHVSRAVILNSTNRLNRCRLTREEQRFNFTPVPQCAGVHIPMSQHSIPPPSRQPKNRFEVQF